MGINNIPPLFGIVGDVTVSELSAGHINRTFLVESGGQRYILQSLNTEIFRRPETVMSNIALVERAVSKQSDVAVPRYLTAGDRSFVSVDGEIWRMYGYTEKKVQGIELYRSGYAYGAFMRALNSPEIAAAPAIYGFHDFERYYLRLEEKCPDIPAELKNLRERLSCCFAGLPKRIIHGDAKCDNVITGEPSTVIDLDTVMKGYAAIDYGDMIRSAVSSENILLAAVKEVTQGFAAGLKGLLTENEISSLYCGVLWVTGELAVRYLTDFYSGERYFRSKTREQCRERSEQLIAQLEMFTAAESGITEIIKRSFNE